MTETPIIVATINGRDVKAVRPEVGQLALVQHQARILQRDGASRVQAERALSLVYRVVRGAIVDEADLDFIEDGIADKELTIEGVLRAIVTAAEEATAEEAPKPVVRRGRPRKKVA
jgi:hypothetical protein